MYSKLQSKGVAGGDNSGSCARYAYYLDHENLWKKLNGRSEDMIGFFDADGNTVSIEGVIRSINSNTKGLHSKDAKFFSMILNPSESEIKLLGIKREEIILNLKGFVEKVMDRYAIGFGRMGIRSHKDLLYYYTIHEFREDDSGNLIPGIHVHVIISRMGRIRRHKLSPITNHRQHSSDGCIKYGFSRDAFYRDCETIFDNTFDYHRSVSESYDYLNTMIHGSREEKAMMIQAAMEEGRIREIIKTSFTQRAARIAKETRERTLAIISKRLKPIIDRIVLTVRKALESLERHMSFKRIPSSRLYQIRDLLFHSQQRLTTIENPSFEVTTEDSIQELIDTIMPIPELILQYISASIEVVKAQYSKVEKSIVFRHLEALCEALECLISEQVSINIAIKESFGSEWGLQWGVQVAAQLEIQRKEIHTRLHQKIDIDAISKGLSEQQSDKRTVLLSFDVYSCIMSCPDSTTLEVMLLAHGTTIHPLFHPKGGVADLSIHIGSDTLIASRIVSENRLPLLLEKWCELTGQRSAFHNNLSYNRHHNTKSHE